MTGKKKYHYGGNVPTPPGQRPHPPIGRDNRPRNLQDQVRRRVTMSPEEAALRRRIAEQQQRRRMPGLGKPGGPTPFPSPIQQPRPIRGAVPVQATPQPMPTERQRPVQRRQTPLRPESTTPRPPQSRQARRAPVNVVENAKTNAQLLKQLAQGTIGRGGAKRSTGTPKPSRRSRPAPQGRTRRKG